MPSFLRDVHVSKVSFVRKAANKRKFLLLKSADVINTNINEEYTPMRKEVKEKIVTLCKAAENVEKSAADIMVLLKADAELKLEEKEVAEATDFISFAKEIGCAAPASASKNADAEKKAKEEKEKEAMKKADTNLNDSINDSNKKVEDLVKQVSSLQAQLKKSADDMARRDVIKFLQDECSFLTEDINKAADTIMQIAAIDATAAENYKQTLKKASAAVEQSALLKESGSSLEDMVKSESETNLTGFDIIKKFSDSFATLKKSASADGKHVSVEQITDLVKGFGSRYNDYRVSHILRARQHAI